MTASISAAMRTHLDGAVTSLAMCWKITRVDGTEFFFTNHDQDITFDGDTYIATVGFEQTAIANSSGMAVDNLEVQGVLSTESEAIKEDELRAGLFDYAIIEIFLINWQSVSDGIIRRKKGRIGVVTTAVNGTFKAELDGLMRNLAQQIVDVYAPECRVDLGSTACGIDIEALKFEGTVVTVTDRRIFTVTLDDTAPADDWFNYGVLKWNTGDNAESAMEVKDWTNIGGTVELFLAMPFDIGAGDTFTIYPGCDKTKGTCIAKFNNIINFRGFPDVPGQDQLFQYPNAR